MRGWSYNVLYVYRRTTNDNDDDDDDEASRGLHMQLAEPFVKTEEW